MACRGVHFAITFEEAERLRSIKDEEERLNHFHEVIDKFYFYEQPELKAASDKAWDAMHRVLTDGQLDWDNGFYPLNHVVLGGESLYTGDHYIMSLKTPEQVRDIAEALSVITEQEFHRRYFAMDQESYEYPLSEEDYQYTWGWFQNVRDLYQRAARDGRCVLFEVDQ
jgi:hypothetical protein